MDCTAWLRRILFSALGTGSFWSLKLCFDQEQCSSSFCGPSQDVGESPARKKLRNDEPFTSCELLDHTVCSSSLLFFPRSEMPVRLLPLSYLSFVRAAFMFELLFKKNKYWAIWIKRLLRLLTHPLILFQKKQEVFLFFTDWWVQISGRCMVMSFSRLTFSLVQLSQA